jgi:predicted RNA-binding Zn-ribbon protein involved in translation (DUF1610 family)
MQIPQSSPSWDPEFELSPSQKPVVGARSVSHAVAPMTSSSTKPCPFCGEQIKNEAKKCRYCGEMLDPVLIQQSLLRASEAGFRCPFCQSSDLPEVKRRVSTAGWVIFVVLLIACFPLCIIGLFLKEDYRVCSGCGIKLG